MLNKPESYSAIHKIADVVISCSVSTWDSLDEKTVHAWHLKAQAPTDTFQLVRAFWLQLVVILVATTGVMQLRDFLERTFNVHAQVIDAGALVLTVLLVSAGLVALLCAGLQTLALEDRKHTIQEALQELPPGSKFHQELLYRAERSADVREYLRSLEQLGRKPRVIDMRIAQAVQERQNVQLSGYLAQPFK